MTLDPSAHSMSQAGEYEEFIEKVRDIHRFDSISGHLGWDQLTLMPEEGAAARAGILAWLAGKSHSLLVAQDFGVLIERLENSLEALDDDQVANIREMAKAREKAVLLPLDHVSKAASLPSKAVAIWAKARADADFTSFENTLRELVEVARERISYLRKDGQTPYDVLLEDFEVGMTVADYDLLFEELRQSLVPLLGKIMLAKEKNPGPSIPSTSNFPISLQDSFCRRVAEKYGFNFSAGRMDISSHPFSAGLWSGDTRFTTRYDEAEPFSCIGAVMHETGHALYEQGLLLEHEYTPRGQAVSLGVHESQSRLWENQIGRSEAFWKIAGNWFRQSFQDCPDWSDEDLHRLINRVDISFIRVEADEVTYNLHVMLRYEVEKAIFNDGMDVSEIPQLWNSLFEEWFGIAIPNDTLGCLQDVHWASLAFGYFPTYTLGNLYSAQLIEKMVIDLDKDLECLISDGEMPLILQWLRENIHSQGKKYEPSKLIEIVTGKPPTPEPFLSYLKRKYSAIYGL